MTGDFQIDPNKRKPGWYPDPEGNPNLQRWWGPVAWSSQTRPSESAGRPGNRAGQPNPERGNIILGFGLLAVIGALVIWGIISVVSGDDDETPTAAPAAASTATTTTTAYDPTPTAGAENTETAKDACEGSVKNQLKDPDSAKFRGLQVVEMSAAGWSIVGEVNANNSFGGKTGYFPFSCYATMRDAETVNAKATLLESVR